MNIIKTFSVIVFIFLIGPSLKASQNFDEFENYKKLYPDQTSLNNEAAKYIKDSYDLLNTNFTFASKVEEVCIESPHWPIYWGEQQIEGEICHIPCVCYPSSTLNLPPSEALDSLMNSKGSIDGRFALEITIMNVLKHILGNNFFNVFINTFCEKKGKSPITLGWVHTPFNLDISFSVDDNKEKLRLLKFFNQPIYNLKNKQGIFGYIPNVAAYNYRHPHGSAKGENVGISSINEGGEPIYEGFGSCFKQALRKRTNIKEYLYQQYKQNPSNSYQSYCIEDNESNYNFFPIYTNRKTWGEEFDLAQRKQGVGYCLNAKFINILLDLYNSHCKNHK